MCVCALVLVCVCVCALVLVCVCVCVHRCVYVRLGVAVLVQMGCIYMSLLFFAYVCMLTAFETPSLLQNLVNKESESNCFINCERQSHRTVSTDHNLSEKKREPRWNRAVSLGQTGSLAKVGLCGCVYR